MLRNRFNYLEGPNLIACVCLPVAIQSLRGPMADKVKVSVVLDRASGSTRPPDHLESQFAQIADSPILSTAPLLRTLLIYLWNHRDENLSEAEPLVAVDGRLAHSRSTDRDARGDQKRVQGSIELGQGLAATSLDRRSKVTPLRPRRPRSRAAIHELICGRFEQRSPAVCVGGRRFVLESAFGGVRRSRPCAIAATRNEEGGFMQAALNPRRR